VHTGRASTGELVLVHAANSGVSTFAIQIACALGARVIATARNEEKLQAARRLGAEYAINSATQDVPALVRQVTDGRGVDLVFDHVGRALFDVSLRCLAPGGRLVVCGASTGSTAQLDLTYLYRMGLTVSGVEAYSRSEFPAILDWLWSTDVRPVVDAYVPLGEAAVAHERMERNDVIGKLVLIPTEGACRVDN
jgi:NADPH:quinone reductase-like Zn-dependent oxidoreductase